MLFWICMKIFRFKVLEYEIVEGGVCDVIRGLCEEILDWMMDS